jgi:hypothetical protein
MVTVERLSAEAIIASNETSQSWPSGLDQTEIHSSAQHRNSMLNHRVLELLVNIAPQVIMTVMAQTLESSLHIAIGTAGIPRRYDYSGQCPVQMTARDIIRTHYTRACLMRPNV